ncbi:MAG: aminopeptidase P family protein [Acidobacteria bacterium]|nr:aminopeptidase P family protein [Acidobacteriota bacterium]
MLNRRSFVKLGSVAAGGSLASACAAPAPAPTPAAATAGNTPAEVPSIAALTSMQGKATPISIDERRGRVEKARRLMAEHKIDALLLTGGTSLVYFSGIRWGLSERMFGLVIPRAGDPFVVCPAFEEDRAREQFATSPFTGEPDVRTWEEHESPYQRLAAGLKDRGITSGRVGVEETVRHVFVDGLAQAAPALALVSGTPVTAGCRIIKDAHELELMRIASAVTLKAYEAAWKGLKEGMTQRDFSDLISAAHAKLGYPGGASVQTAEFSALPHGSIQPQVIREGTIILIDGGCAVEGYQSDISRTFVLGKPTDKMKAVYDIEYAAQTAALKAARPGVPCEAVDAAARKVIVDAGYGPDYKFFTHRVGHGMGMDGHEWPYLVRGNTLPLAPGMTFSDEPGIYIPGEFGVRLEDDMVITENGAELMTPQSPSLEDPFGPARS